jgi:pimeloyl-ACP methyl ester carboxylesterase
MTTYHPRTMSAPTDPPTDPNDWGARDPRWAGIRSDTIDVLGRPVSILRHEAAGDGPPQLLVHGLASSSRSWLEVITPLAEHGEVVAVDLPGFGHTPVPPGGSARIRANAHFIGALLDALGWERVRMSGSSMGGLVVTLAAGRQPERFESLVLVNPGLPALRRDMWKIPKRSLVRIVPAAIPGVGRLLVDAGYRSKSAEELVDESFAGIFVDAAAVRSTLRDVIVENVAQAQEHPWRRHAIYEAASSLVAMHIEGREIGEAIAAITAPTMIIWGDGDLLVGQHVIDGLLSRRSDWHLHVFPAKGHAPMIECPTEFLEVVHRWYAGEVPDASPAIATAS